jgi:hypothetical protein
MLRKNDFYLLLIRSTLTLTLTLTSPKAKASFLEEALDERENQLSSISVESYLKDPWAQHSTPPTWRDCYPWKTGIMTTVFWIGEQPTCHNPTPNDKSSWDSSWKQSYGGYDCPNPKGRIGFRPAGFVPRQNPFYCALPYNDVDHHGTKLEASHVIPWFKACFEHNGKSVVKGRWLAIHHNGKICFAQWEDSGPYRTDHWEYVFGNARPSPNRNGGAGLDISPAVRDYLGIDSKSITDWKFVENEEVPTGPWSKYGENNPFSPYFKQTRDYASN